MDPLRALVVLLLLSQTLPHVSSFGMNIIAVLDDDELLVQCTYKLIKKYFRSGESLSGSVLAVSLTSAAPRLQNRMLQAAFHLDTDNSWSVVVRYPKRRAQLEEPTLILHEKPQAYFAVVENLDDEDMDDVFADWKAMPNWNPLAQFVVFFSTLEDTEEEMTELMVEILLMFMSRKIFNINVIAQAEVDGRVYSKTAFPYEPENNCGSRVIAFQTLDICDFEDDESGVVNVKQHNRGLFLDKIPKDLSGCALVAFSRAWEPYMFSEDGQMKGIEWMLVQTIADSLHIGIEILIQNKTLFHIFQGLIDGDVDIVIGGIDEDPNLSNYVSASVPYLQDDLTWCVTKAKKALHWLNFLQVFSLATYLTYLVFIIVNATAIYTIQRYLCTKVQFHNDFFSLVLMLWGIALSQSTRATNFQSCLRMCMMMALSASLILGSVYNSFLISSLTSPSTMPQIKEATQIFEYKMAVTGSVDMIRHLDKDGDIFRYIRREFVMCYNVEECLQKAAYDQHLAVAVSRQHTIHNPRIQRDNLYCFDRDENIYTYLVTMLMPKKFHLFHQINPIIQYVIESGHLLKWTRDLELQRMLKAIRKVEDNGVRSLKINQISGIFAFASILIVFALIAFGIELLVYRMYRRGTRVKLVKIMHRNFSKTN